MLMRIVDLPERGGGGGAPISPSVWPQRPPHSPTSINPRPEPSEEAFGNCCPETRELGRGEAVLLV